MSDFFKLYLNSYLILVVVTTLVLIHYYNKEKKKIQDLNKDGVIDEHELNYHIMKEAEIRSRNPPNIKGLIKSSLSGMIRGLVVGYFLGG